MQATIGIGAVLLHKFVDGSTKPIFHTSRSLLPAEKNFSQIEKERQAMIYAIKKFHRFIHGRSFILQTDHKPLLAIFGSKKGIPSHTANRLQRWSIILLNNNSKMEYVSSKKIAHADGLSRLIPKRSELLEERAIVSLKEEEEELWEILVSTIRELPVILENIKKAAKMDEFIVGMKKQVRWNEKKKKGRKVLPFSICGETLMYADRVIMPRVLQKRILKEFHKGHPGICRMKSLMRSYIYWPKMDQDIEKRIRECKGCQLAAPPIKAQPIN